MTTDRTSIHKVLRIVEHYNMVDMALHCIVPWKQAANQKDFFYIGQGRKAEMLDMDETRIWRSKKLDR